MKPTKSKLLIVTGLPASGKSTVARSLARRYHAPLIAKDAIKEPLFDVLGADSAAQSRKLSDASFAVMFALTRELLAAGVSAVLEGNFRAGEHEAALRAQLASLSAVPLAQLLCRIDEAERTRRLAARANNPTRHPGHRDFTLIGKSAPRSDGFLSLEGEQLLYEGDRTLAALDSWWSR